MIATWCLKDDAGATIASGTIRQPMPHDGVAAYELALRLANGVEAGLVDYIGSPPADAPLLRAAE